MAGLFVCLFYLTPRGWADLTLAVTFATGCAISATSTNVCLDDREFPCRAALTRRSALVPFRSSTNFLRRRPPIRDGRLGILLHEAALSQQRPHGNDAEGTALLINLSPLEAGIGYSIGHYARWVKPGAVRVDATSSDPLVQVSAFRDDNRSTVALVLINNAAKPRSVSVNLTGLSVVGNLTGEQSNASGYWKPLAAFAASSPPANIIFRRRASPGLAELLE
jgi:hypothetical protein